MVDSPLAHVVYVTEEDDRGDGLTFLLDVMTEPVVVLSILLGAILGGAVVTGYLRWQPARRDLLVGRTVLEGYRDLLPWLLRLGFGLPLVGAGFTGDFFNPIVTPVGVPALTRVLQIILGFAILFGLATRVAATLTLLWYIGSIPFAPALVYSPEWIPGLVAIIVLGSGRPSADQVLERVAAADGTRYGSIDPVHRLAPSIRRAVAPVRPFVPTILRVGLGLTFAGLGLVEKLLSPRMAADVVAQYELTQVIPIDPAYWIVAAGLSEIIIGVALVLGIFTRFFAGAALAVFVLALVGIPDDPVLAHIGIFAMTAALLITGGGPWSIDDRLRAEGGSPHPDTA